MDLPVRIVSEPPRGAFVCADGHLPGAVLELSHWPGNSTPADLRHDLSTGAALAFARLDRAERLRRAAGALCIVNNHFDTDGSCSLFALRHPALALERTDALLAAAAAGDFFAWPDDQALCIDAAIGGLPDPERSPLARVLAGRSDQARRQLATEHLLEHLPALLDGELGPYRELWEPVLEDARADRADLGLAARDDLVHLDWSIWSAPRSARSTRAAGLENFDPGRHALWGASAHDRQLVIGPQAEGTTYRLLFGTRSWFDLASGPGLTRPDLAGLVRELDTLEGSRPEDELAWRCQDAQGPSPELWFGLREQVAFDEHAPALRPSRLEPARVRRAISDSLRAALASLLA